MSDQMCKIQNLTVNDINPSIDLLYVNRKIIKMDKYIYKYLLYDGEEYIQLMHYNIDILKNYEFNDVLFLKSLICKQNENSKADCFNTKNFKLEYSAKSSVSRSSYKANNLKKKPYNLNQIQQILTKSNKLTKLINLDFCHCFSIEETRPKIKDLTKIKFLNEKGDISIDCIIWNSNPGFYDSKTYIISEVMLKKDENSCELIFNDFTTFYHVEDFNHQLTMKKTLRQLIFTTWNFILNLYKHWRAQKRLHIW
jgi:hypothetical protein